MPPLGRGPEAARAASGGSVPRPTYWRSLDELADTPAFRAFSEAEFPSAAPARLAPTTRREFLRLMGASAALAGLTGCRWPKEVIAPYGQQPENRTPGVPVQYATAMELGGWAQGLLVTSYDGRPIKIEGNPSHPLNRGATDARAQASVLELYDPDRAHAVCRRDGQQYATLTWEDFAAFARPHFDQLRQRGGAGLCVLSAASSSLSLADMRARLLAAFPQARWLEWEPLSRDNERLGALLAFGRPHRTHLHPDRADVIVALDDDFLGAHPAAVQYARDFITGRRIDATGRRIDAGGPEEAQRPAAPMNRLYVVESGYSITGAMADHRYPLRSCDVPAFAACLAAQLVERGLALPPEAGELSAVLKGAAEGRGEGPCPRGLADELLGHRGRCLITVGPHQPPEVHALVHVLNAALGNVGTTLTYTVEPDESRPTHVAAIGQLVAAMRAGQVDTLLILGGNPAYDAPADLELAGCLASVETTIHLSLHRNETSRLCLWNLPQAHYLESWGDARAYDGTLSIVQPLIAPLYDGKTPAEVIALLLGEEPATGYEIVRRALQALQPGTDFESWWRQALHDGVVPGTAFAAVSPTPRGGEWAATIGGWVGRPTAQEDGLEVVFRPSAAVYDGRFANNGWLPELPDPITKLTWDNPALLAPATAAALGVESGDIVRLTLGARSLEVPVYVLPGHAAGSVTLLLGYGRSSAGRVGDGVGCNTYALRTTEGLDVAYRPVVVKTGRRCKLATTQDHHAIRSRVGERAGQARVGLLVREATVEEYRRHPQFAREAVHHLPLVSLWQEHSYEQGHRWAMAIDLNACIGCSACVVACQAENNVPVVGKDEVERGREMHWLRVDRYFRGAPHDPQVAFQPVPCMHCENAPCEQVCPVAATVHSSEGLNDMVYNRCIGTRYCANNCPYKVRRFNWFNNHRDLTEIEKLAFNPEVTVRSRGVMEKCTYCVQRINAVKIAAGNERRAIRDGEITPACAQACPTQAIVFGDLNDPDSRVARLHTAERAYGILEELNVKPRTKYLARLRNPASTPGNRTDQ